MVRQILKDSLKRGAVQVVRRPMYVLMIIIMPLLCCFALINMLSKGTIQRVPVGIVDLDNSDVSRRLQRNLGAFQQVDIRENFTSFADARDAVQRGRVLGFFYIPQDFQAELMAGRQPKVSYYINYAYYAPGSMQYKGFKTISIMAGGAVVQTALRTVGLRDEQITPQLLPYANYVHMPGNPWINYNYYLNASFVPCFLSLFILMVTAFALGTELKSGLSRQWLHTAGDNIFIAVCTKLLPHTILFTVVGWAIQWLMYVVYEFPLHCSPLVMILSMPLLVIANQAFAVMAFCVVPNFRFGTTVVTLLGMLSFSFCGFSLPSESLYPWIAPIGYLMPIKYYFMISCDQALNGIPLYFSRYYFAALIAFVLLPLPLLWRLKREASNPVYIP
mgnify:CR=1 FL=1